MGITQTQPTQVGFPIRSQSSLLIKKTYMKAIIETRSQKASGRAWPSKGPDKYVAVQLVPDGVQPLDALREDSAKKRGIEIIRCGDYYWNSTGPRSRYAKAMAEAEKIAAKYNH